MKPYYQDNHDTLYCLDFRKNDLPDESVQMVVTSPPYWGLRKYSGEQDLIWGDEKNCQHEWVTKDDNAEGYTGRKRWQHGISRTSNPDGWSTDIRQHGFCSLCGAWKGALGLEPEPSMYIDHLVQIFEEVKRVLRRDGVCFVNCGDSYYANPGLSKSSQRGGVPREGQSGKRGKGLSDLKSYDSSSESPCDECVKIRLLRTTGKSGYPGLISETSSVESSRSHKVSMLGHQDSLRSASQGGHTEGDTSGLDCEPSSVDADALGVQESTNPESSEQLLAGCLPKGDWFSSLDVLASLSLVFQECGHRKACPFLAQTFAGVSQESLVEAGSKAGISLIAGASASHTRGKVSDSPSYPYYTTPPHLKAKDLCLIPQRLAIAFQDAGWWVRSIIIWSKPNPMPESVTDRPTESHEYILLLTKSARYYWDADAVRTGYQQSSIDRADGSKVTTSNPDRPVGFTRDLGNGANLKSVWEFPTQPYPEAHFAVFPEKLPELCIKAATPEVGCCAECGAPWERIMERSESSHEAETACKNLDPQGNTRRLALIRQAARAQGHEYYSEIKTIGWQPTCKCNADKVPSIVLDPFAGAGTTLWVAKKLNREAIGFELSEEYCHLTVERLRQQGLL